MLRASRSSRVIFGTSTTYGLPMAETSSNLLSTDGIGGSDVSMSEAHFGTPHLSDALPESTFSIPRFPCTLCSMTQTETQFAASSETLSAIRVRGAEDTTG